MKLIAYIFTTILLSSKAFASVESASEIDNSLQSFVDSMFSPIIDVLGGALFYPISIPLTSITVPFLILWLIAGGVFFTLRLGFVNLRLFAHALKVITGKYSSKDDPGEITHSQALCSAVSATVGLGNIAGVAIAVSLGGPGAVIWMVVGGFFGMSTKFSEVLLGLKYRKFDENGRVSGGAFHYLRDGLAELGMKKLGVVLSVIFALFCLGGSLGGGNMFQSHETISILTQTILPQKVAWVPSLLLAVIVGAVLLGGIKRIANFAEAIVPIMAFIYISATITVLIVNIDNLPDAISTMFSEAFTMNAAGGGMIGAIIAGFKRSAFSNEAGLGSAPIAHAAAKTTEPVREGCVALLEPFIDTIVICFLTGMVITVTGVYQGEAANGVLMTSEAFATVIDWFPNVLSIAVTLFAFSTMLTWSYYGERSWGYLFGKKYVWVYYIIFCSCTFIGGIADLGTIIDISDLLLLSMALPNLIGLYLLSNVVAREMKDYTKRLRNNEFKTYK